MIHPIIFSRRAKTSCQRATPKTLISLTSIWQISSLTPFHHNRFLSFHFSCPLSTGRELSTLPTSSSFSGPLSISEPDEDQETLINKSLKLKVFKLRNKTYCHNKCQRLADSRTLEGLVCKCHGYGLIASSFIDTHVLVLFKYCEDTVFCINIVSCSSC